MRIKSGRRCGGVDHWLFGRRRRRSHRIATKTTAGVGGPSSSNIAIHYDFITFDLIPFHFHLQVD